MWTQGTILQEYKDASIIHLYKWNGNRQSCNNYQGICLLSIAGKILLTRLVQHIEQWLLPESQCGFKKGHGTIDMVFAAHQLQEKCQEQNSNLYMTSIDLTKAFDTVNCEGLRKIMAKFGCPEKFIAMIWQFHDGILARAMDDSESSEPFPVARVVKQGCVLVPTLFSMIFSSMLIDAFCDCDTRIGIRYRTASKLFNLRRQQAKMKVQEVTVHDLLFADDCSLNAISESDMQRSLDYFSSACDNFGGLCANGGIVEALVNKQN
ncbi:uncharacterized protein LOC117874448 [Trachemys scripta elegans]|uniref:uncharacterized protein LOC117874448 n=1 Tax=Trachemys scripta elegans TaxID=31138 RepID=UPI001555394D|nr:uncharacterized protein LOC117874448 [Trachemys scripta elegans]